MHQNRRLTLDLQIQMFLKACDGERKAPDLRIMH